MVSKSISLLPLPVQSAIIFHKLEAAKLMGIKFMQQKKKMFYLIKTYLLNFQKYEDNLKSCNLFKIIILLYVIYFKL